MVKSTSLLSTINKALQEREDALVKAIEALEDIADTPPAMYQMNQTEINMVFIARKTLKEIREKNHEC